MEKLGIDPILILVQFINFGLLLFILKKFLYAPVLKIIKDRQEKTAAVEKEKEALEKEREELELRKDKLLAASYADKRKLIDEARKEAEEQRIRIIDKASKEAKEILSKATKQSKRENEDVKRKIENESVELALAMVKKIMGKLDKRSQEKSIHLALKELSQLKKENEIR